MISASISCVIVWKVSFELLRPSLFWLKPFKCIYGRCCTTPAPLHRCRYAMYIFLRVLLSQPSDLYCPIVGICMISFVIIRMMVESEQLEQFYLFVCDSCNFYVLGQWVCYVYQKKKINIDWCGMKVFFQ